MKRSLQYYQCVDGQHGIFVIDCHKNHGSAPDNIIQGLNRTAPDRPVLNAC
jgi:hypothetical protein